jgi:group I intron endonuclease
MIIYKVTNIENAKVYIGKTIRELKVRKWAHYNSAKNFNSPTNFHRALMKYPKEFFIWEVIATADDDIELNKLEIKFIKEFDSYKSGYNMSEGGTGGLTYKKGTELYERIKSKLGKWKNGNPGATSEAIKKRIETFKEVKWKSGKLHGNFGHKNNIGIMAGSKNPMSKKVEVDGIIYDTVTSAAKTKNVSEGTLRYRLKSKNFKNYKYV